MVAARTEHRQKSGLSHAFGVYDASFPGMIGVRWTARIEARLTGIVALTAALLLAAEVAILLAGVIARYGFGRPLIWSDELASILFLWLAMLGAVIAFARGDHMRMTALVRLAGPTLRIFLDSMSAIGALGFLVFMLPSSVSYAREEGLMVSPALEISGAWRATAVPVGIGLMALLGALRLPRLPDSRIASAAALSLALVVAVFFFLRPVFAEAGNYNLLIFFVGLFGMAVAIGAPIAFAFGLASAGYVTFATHAPMLIVSSGISEGMSHLILLAVPLFIFLGMLIEMTGMARAMVQFLTNLLGHINGGLSFALIGAMYLVSGISGAKGADMAAVAPALFPEMRARGAKGGDLVALLAATGAQTETIPPSLVLITIASVTGVSISALFTGGLLPGLVLGATLCAAVVYKNRGAPIPETPRANWGVIGRSFVVALPALAVPFLIRAAVIEGIATATEVSTLGIVYTFAIGWLAYRRCDWRRIIPMLVDSAALSGAILFVIGAATAMSWGLTQSGFARDLIALMARTPGGAAGFLAISVVAFIVLGSVLEGIPAIVLFGPLLFPIARVVGINQVHYAMVVILAMGLGLFAPPFGVGYYTACAVGRVSPEEGMRAIWGYLLALLLGVILIAAFPWLSTRT
jgi:tripartite ATP-independent transporter DctM subunit